MKIDSLKKILNNKSSIDIVYDIDDVINELNKYVFSSAGLTDKYKDIIYYDIDENTHVLTREEMDRLNSFYENPLSYKLAELANGAADIPSIESLNNRVKIHMYSVCMSSTVKDIKIDYLKRNIPKINLNNCTFIFSDDKKPLEYADIVIEDKAENILRYRDTVIKILIDKPYNRKILENKRVDNLVRVDSLVSANKLIKQLVME